MSCIIKGPHSISYGENVKTKAAGLTQKQQAPFLITFHWAEQIRSPLSFSVGLWEPPYKGTKKLRTCLFMDHPAVEHQEAGISAASHYITTPSIDLRLLELSHKSSSSGVWHSGSL